MPGNEHKTLNRAENHARSAIISSTVSTDNSISRTTLWRGINKISKCFSCPGDCKQLSKQTKGSTYNSNQARTKPWPTQPPTSDNNSPITKHIRHKCFSNLGDCSRLSNQARRWNSMNQGSSQSVGSGLHVRVECKLTS